MKRKFFLIWILSGMLCGINAKAQQVTVADGTSESLYYPLSVYHWTQSQHSQSIYPASMLTELQGHYITTLTWYFVTMPTLQWNGIQTVRLGVTNDNNLLGGFSGSPTVEVWSGQMSAFFEEGCLRIPLDTAFLYTGGNLLVEVYKPAGGSYGSEHFYGQIQSSSQMPLLISSINVVGNNSNVPYEGNILPKLTFTYQDNDCSFPEMLASFGITTSTANLSWVPGVLGMANQYQVAYRTSADTSYTEVMVSDTFCTLSNLIPNTTYYWKVKALCGDSASSDWSLERTFTTLRTYANVPYYCDFEDSVENALWYLPTSYPYWYYGKWFIGSYVSYSGNNSLYITYDDGVTNTCSSSASDLEKIWSYREFYLDPLYPQYVISFKHRGYGRTTPYFGPSGNTTLKKLCSGSFLPYDSVWMDHSYTFSVDTPGVYRLSFRWYKWEDDGKPGISIDDISITGVSCLPPNTLTTTNITDSSATLSWQHDCVDAPMGYIVGYKTAGDYNYTEFTVYDTNSVTLTGLSIYTDYYWRVKTLYNDSVSTDWSSVATFKTELQWVHPLPYYCDFEDAVENLAWNVPVISGNNKNRWYLGHNTYHSANTSLYVTTKANGSDNNYVYTSESALWTYRDVYFDPQYAGYEFSFDAKVRGDENNAYAMVYIGAPISPSDSMPMDSLVQIGDKIHHTSNDYSPAWKHYEYTLESTFAGVRRIYFFWQNHNINSGYYPAIAIDDISITGTSCARPLHLSDIPSDTTAQLTWQACEFGSPESYTVAYKSASDSAYTEIATSDTTITLNGLQPLTDYTWKVRTNCSDEEHSEWSTEQNFSTFQTLATMPYAYGFEESSENAAWANYYEASQHKWCIGSTVQHNGQYSSYISKDNGATYQTNNPNYAEAYLYRDFFFDPTYDEYVLEFDFKTFDTTSQTDISVYVVSPASPGFSAPSNGSLVETILFTDTLWHHVSIAINRTHVGVQRLVFEWAKDNYNLAKGSCAVDDITFTAVAFGRPYDLVSSNVTHNAALLTWTSGNRQAPASYQLAYREDADTAYTIVSLTDTVWQAASLMSATRYHWKVRAVAADGTLSAWSKEAVFFTAAITPYFTDFENDADWGGWHQASVSFNNDGWIIGDAVAFGGSYSLYVSHDDGVTNTCNSMYSNEDPISVYRDVYFVPGADEYLISFDYLGIEAEIKLQSLEDSLSNAVLVGSVPSSNQWQHHYIVIDSSFSGFQRLFFDRIRADASDKAGAVDNLKVSVSTCPPPTMLVTTMTAPNAARFTWSPVGSQAYTLAYKPQGDTVYTMVNVQDTSVLITNLIPDIPYFWKVRTQCGDDPGDWSSECPFHTQPLLPYFCDFEDGDEIDHWTYDHGSDWNYLTIGAAPMDNGNVTLHVGSAFGDGNYNYYATARLWAYRDIFLGGDVDKYQISFDYRGLGQTDADFARVYLGPPATPSGLNAPEGAEQLGGDLCMVPSWTHYSFEVDSSHSGLQRIYFQWRCDSYNGMNPGAAIDNITVQVSDCAIPVNLVAHSTTDTSVTLSWNPGNANALPMSYTVAYKLLNDSAFIEVTSADTFLQITGLLPDSYYYWMVRANCSDTDHSLWSNGARFTTLQPMCATLPYECGFEDASENTSWSFVCLSGPNEWMIGDGVHLSGDSALYVTDDSATNHYSNGSVSQIWAYRDIYFPPGNDEYDLSFDFKGKGSSSHYAKVFLGTPATPFETFTPEGSEQLGASLYNQESWQHYHFYIDAAHSGVQRLYVMWTNNTYSVTQPPAAFDNFEIAANPCREPVELWSAASDSNATLSWTLRRGGQGTNYTVAYRPQNDTAYTYVTVSDTFLTVQNLLSNVFYYWKVKQNCDVQYSQWSEESSFYTNGNILYVCDFDTPESVSSWQMSSNVSSQRWFVGRHAECMPNGTLYVSSDNGQTNSYNPSVTANCWAYTDIFVTPGHSTYYFSFDFKGMGEYNYDYVDAFVGPTTLPSGNSTPSGALKLASKLCLKDGWTHYQYTFDSTHTGLQRIYFLWRNDNSGGTNPPAAIDNVCLSTEDMQPPMMQVVPTDISALVTWNMADTLTPASYTVEYAMLTDSVMAVVTVNDTMCNITNLQPVTDYLVRVRANYADGQSGLWQMREFQTQHQLAHIPYYCDFEDPVEVNSWQYVSYGSVNQWVVDTAATQSEGHSLYVSNDGGLTNAYTFNSPSTLWAYRDFHIDPEQNPYQITFDFRGIGEIYNNTVYDYAKVFIGPVATPNVGSNYVVILDGAVQIDTILYQRDQWTTYSDTFNATTSVVRLYILWRNDGSLGNNPAGAFDNICIVPFGCNPPAAIAIDSVSYTEMSFSITDILAFHHEWDITLLAEGDTLDESLVLTLQDTMSHTFTELDSGTVYTLYVRTRCDEEDFSDWITLTFCTLIDTSIVDTTQIIDSVSVAHYLLEHAISIFPNPATHHLDVRAESDINISFIEIYDIYGRLVLRSEAIEDPKRVHVSKLSSGTYLMRINTDKGAVTKKFVKR